MKPHGRDPLTGGVLRTEKPAGPAGEALTEDVSAPLDRCEYCGTPSEADYDVPPRYHTTTTCREYLKAALRGAERECQTLRAKLAQAREEGAAEEEREEVKMSEQLAIIKEVGFGCRDVGRPVLWFTTYISEGEGALQVIDADTAIKMIAASDVYEVHKLEGKPCWVEMTPGMIRFLRLAKIP